MGITSMNEIFIKIFGQVQGVGFRYQTCQKASELNLAGFVRNAPNQSVEILAQGPKANLEKLLDWVKNGSSFAQVENVKFEWREPKNKFAEFQIKY